MTQSALLALRIDRQSAERLNLKHDIALFVQLIFLAESLLNVFMNGHKPKVWGQL